MSGNLKLYTIAIAGLNGATMVEEQELDVEMSSNSQPVHTVAGQYSGESPGSGMIEIQMKSAIPAAGFEFDASKQIAGLIPVDVSVTFAGKQLLGQGFVVAQSLRHGVDTQASQSLRIRMPLSLFQ